MRSCSRSAAGVCVTVRAGFAAGLTGPRRRCRLKPAEIAAGGQRNGRAQQRRRSPKAAAHPGLVPSRTPVPRRLTRMRSSALIPAEQLNLPHPDALDPRPAARLDPATNPNPPIFE